MSNRICTIEGCGAKHYAWDLCQRHYMQDRRANGARERSDEAKAPRQAARKNIGPDQALCTHCQWPRELNLFTRADGSTAKTCSICRARDAARARVAYSTADRRLRDSNFGKFGITRGDFERILDLQKHLCAICLQPETRLVKGVAQRLVIDHCHSTGSVRGLLCMRCNIALGQMKDDADRLRSAAAYVESGGFDYGPRLGPQALKP